MRPDRVARRVWRGVALAGLGVAGGVALVTARHRLMTPQPLESGLPGVGRIDRKHGGEVYYVVAGPEDGRPLVLLHGFYPGASNHEFRAVFERLAETYRVYAPDWLGFGMSERPRLSHTGEFYVSILRGFLRDVVGAPAMVVAHGLAGNIAVTAASEEPALFERLTLVAPEADAGMAVDPTLSQTVTRALQKFALGLTPYAVVSSRPALRIAAGRRSAIGPMQVDDGTLDHLYASAHQFGGEYATLAWLTGELDLPIRHLFPLLTTPTLIMIGARDDHHTQVEMERLVALNRQADLEVVSNAGETVYLDQPRLFINTLRRWLVRRLTHLEPPAALETSRTVPPTLAADAPAVARPLVAQTEADATPATATDEPESPAPKVVPVITGAAPDASATPQAAEVLTARVVPVLGAPSSSIHAPVDDLMGLRAAPTNPAKRSRTPRAEPSHVTTPTAQASVEMPSSSIGQPRAISPSTPTSHMHTASFEYTAGTGVHTLRSDHGPRSTRRR